MAAAKGAPSQRSVSQPPKGQEAFSGIDPPPTPAPEALDALRAHVVTPKALLCGWQGRGRRGR